MNAINKKLKNKKIMSDIQNIINTDNNEIVLLTLKKPLRSFKLHCIIKNYNDAKRQKKILENNGYIVHMCFKTKGNKHTATYLNDFGNSIYITHGINRTIETNNKYLRERNIKLLKSKNNKEKSGYIGFGFSYPTGCFVSTYLYDSYKDAKSHIYKRYGVDKNSIDIIDSSRLHNGKFKFAQNKYDNMFRIKHIKRIKLEERVGIKEASIILNTLKTKQEKEKQQQKVVNPIKEELKLDIDIDNNKIIKLLEHVVDKMQETQLYIIENEKEVFDAKVGNIITKEKIEKARNSNNKINNSITVAQELIKILLDVSNNNNNNINV